MIGKPENSSGGNPPSFFDRLLSKDLPLVISPPGRSETYEIREVIHPDLEQKKMGTLDTAICEAVLFDEKHPGGEDIVLKVKEFTSDFHLNLFFETVSILKEMDHSNIISLAADAFNKGTVFFLPLKGRGKMFTSFLQGRIISMGEKYDWAMGLVSALAALHRKNRPHGDLKLSNIIVCHGTPQLIDFGPSYGTPGWRHPGIIHAHITGTDIKRIETASLLKWDVYTMGLILYHLFCYPRPLTSQYWITSAVDGQIREESAGIHPEDLKFLKKELTPLGWTGKNILRTIKKNVLLSKPDIAGLKSISLKRPDKMKINPYETATRTGDYTLPVIRS